jgi:uncharacterized membrane protein
MPFLTLKDSSPQVANAFVNLYRAEISNMAAYRTRLDTSMNWAVSMTGLCRCSFKFSRSSVAYRCENPNFCLCESLWLHVILRSCSSVALTWRANCSPAVDT